MSGKRITSRCRPTTVRNVFDNITPRFTDEATNILKKLHLHQFTRLHGIKQDSVAITSILSCWDIKKQAFQLGGQYIPFTPDEVALMIGMPNRGEKVVWQKSPLSLLSSSDYKSQLENSDGSLPAAQFVQLYIRFLLSNLFFVYHNYRVASELIAYADDIDRFADYNWADAIWDFLVSQFDVIASKIQTQRAAGYMSGFVTLLMIWAAEHISIISPSSEPAKPRMLRWAKIEFPKNAFTGLGGSQVRLSFEDLLEDENWLLQSGSPAQQSTHVEPDSCPVLSPITAAPTDSPYSSPRYSPPSSVSSLPSATTPTADHAVERMFAGLKDLRETVSSLHATVTERLDGLCLRVAAIEDVLARQRGPTTPNAGEATTCTAPEEGTTEEALVEATTGASTAELDTSTGEAHVELTVGEVLVEATTTHDDAPKPVIGSIERGVKAWQIRKRKNITSPYTHTYRKSRARINDVVASTQAAEPAAEVRTEEAVEVAEPQAAIVVVEEQQSEVRKDEPIEVDDPQTAIVVVEEHQSEASEALHVVEFSSRALLPKPMLDLIDTSCSRFEDKGDTVFAAGNIIVARGQIDDLLTDQYLSDAHIDAFAYLLAEKNSLCPGMYVPYLYISCLHWSYARFGLKMESKMFIQHITADSVSRAELILLPVIDNQHWTLLVGHIKMEAWYFYDSLPKPTHKSILPEIIKLLVEDAGQAFASDPSKWPIDIVSGIPVQENSVDCGMFVCKYMEAAISKTPVDWVDHQD